MSAAYFLLTLLWPQWCLLSAIFLYFFQFITFSFFLQVWSMFLDFIQPFIPAVFIFEDSSSFWKQSKGGLKVLFSKFAYAVLEDDDLKINLQTDVKPPSLRVCRQFESGGKPDTSNQCQIWANRWCAGSQEESLLFCRPACGTFCSVLTSVGRWEFAAVLHLQHRVQVCKQTDQRLQSAHPKLCARIHTGKSTQKSI